MKQRIRFVDLHYKGVRIQKGWKNLTLNLFLFFWLSFAMVLTVVFYIVNGEKMDIFEGIKDVGRLVKAYVIPALLLTGMVISSTLLVFYPFWNYVADLQRLCRMIYTYPLYLVRNYVTTGAFQDTDNVKMVREIEYFPNIFYRVKKGNVEITIELDGSKFHQDGSFEDLTKVLEDRFSLNVINITMRREYLTYHLFRDAEMHRLLLEDVVPKRYSIPIMRDVSWEMNRVPHALIVGGTGGGKSFFLNALIRAFLLMGAELYICDPKNSALADYGRIIPHVSSDEEGIQKNLIRCVDVMEQRQKQMKEDPRYIPGQDFSYYNLPPVVLILDEYTAYVATLDRKGKEEFKAYLNQIVLKGREAGVFVVLATQRPDASALDGNIRDQLGFRVVLGTMSDEGYRMTFGNVDQKLKKFGGAGKGYMYMPIFQFIQKFSAPLVPKGYDFIIEAKKLIQGKM